MKVRVRAKMIGGVVIVVKILMDVSWMLTSGKITKMSDYLLFFLVLPIYRIQIPNTTATYQNAGNEIMSCTKSWKKVELRWSCPSSSANSSERGLSLPGHGGGADMGGALWKAIGQEAKKKICRDPHESIIPL